MKNLKQQTESKIEKFWIYLSQLAGFILFIAPLYLPTRAYFFESKESEPIDLKGIAISVFGFFLWRGGKSVGVLANSFGVVILKSIKKVFNIN